VLFSKTSAVVSGTTIAHSDRQCAFESRAGFALLGCEAARVRYALLKRPLAAEESPLPGGVSPSDRPRLPPETGARLVRNKATLQSAERSSEPGTGCTSGKCPKCDKPGHVTVEHVIVGSTTVDYCYCKACGASWVGNADTQGR
jgi:hypothetical protein